MVTFWKPIFGTDFSKKTSRAIRSELSVPRDFSSFCVRRRLEDFFLTFNYLRSGFRTLKR